MLERINPTSTQAWFVLKKHFEEDALISTPSPLQIYYLITQRIL